MAKQPTDVFGFDELTKTFAKMQTKYADESEAVLMAQMTQAQKGVKQRTGKVTGKLQRSWRVLRPKKHRGGTVKVARLQSAAPHSHLYEYPHEVYTTKKRRKTGKVNRYNETARRAMGIQSHGKTQGHYVLRDTMREMDRRFYKSADKMLDKVTEELEV